MRGRFLSFQVYPHENHSSGRGGCLRRFLGLGPTSWLQIRFGLGCATRLHQQRRHALANGRREAQPPFVWPIREAAGVNERRKKAGFTTTVEQNAANLGIQYRTVTLKGVARMPK